MKNVFLALLVFVAAAAFGQVSSFVDVDEITDEVTTFIVIESNDKSAHMVVSETNGEFMSFIYTVYDYLGSGNDECIIRFDDGEIEHYEVVSLSNGEGKAFYDGDTILLIESLGQAEQLVIRVYDYNNISKTYVFEVAGFTAEFKKYYGLK